MELFQISKYEFKITLSSRDLEEFDLTVRTIDYNTAKTRRAIWEIFDRAKSRLGFDAAKSKLRIRVYPLSDGGCDMYVCRLTRRDSNAPSAAKAKLRYSPKQRAFIFESLNDLYASCTIIPQSIPSSLYVDKCGRYILFLTEGLGARRATARISEFGAHLSITYINSYLNERCTLLCSEDAVSKIIGNKKAE